MATKKKPTLDTKGIVAVAKKSQMLQKYSVEYVAIEDVKPNTYNPNRQNERDFELLCRSIQEDGFTQPIIAQKNTKQIVDGEHRWRAARHIGHTTIPVVFVDWTEEAARIATLRHNRARGSEDTEQASQVLRDLRELGSLEWAQDSLMISSDELMKLVGDVSVPDQLAGDKYHEAWLPSKAQGFDGTSNVNPNEVQDGTQAAKVAQEALQKRLDAAKGDSERTTILKAHSKEEFRLVVSFDGAEAALVNKVLGEKKAERLLELCRERYVTDAA